MEHKDLERSDDVGTGTAVTQETLGVTATNTTVDLNTVVSLGEALGVPNSEMGEFAAGLSAHRERSIRVLDPFGIL